jgi:5-methylcytosine-specific restriction endonuclease McrA
VTDRRTYIREYMRKWREDPAKREREQALKRAKYPAKAISERARVLRWAKENPEKAVVITARRRARLSLAEGDYTAQEFADLCDHYGHLCFYCGQAVRLTADHIVPLTRGGSNYISNIIPACQPCNSRKGAKTLEEFLAFLPVG